MKSDLIKYAKGLNASEYIQNWIEKRVFNEYDIKEVEHIIDYFISEKPNKKLLSMTYPQAKLESVKWVKKLANKKISKSEETEEDIETFIDFKDGFKIVKLKSKNSYTREGNLMCHCVASYYGRTVEIYSLRDKDNMPHCTIEKDNQIKGKGNGSIHPNYIEYIIKFLEETGMEVRDSEMSNLGYINVEKLKEDLHKDTKYIKGKYVYKDSKLLDINGNEYYSLDLLDYKPLIIDNEKTLLKINFDLKSFIDISFKLLWSKVNKAILWESPLPKECDSQSIAGSGDYQSIAGSGNSQRIAGSGDSQSIAGSGDYQSIAGSGNSQSIAGSGDYQSIAGSGNSQRIAGSGNSQSIAGSGNYQSIAGSGNYQSIAGSGDYQSIAGSGNSQRIAGSGDSQSIAGSGNSQRIAGSGDYQSIAGSGNSQSIAGSGNYQRIAITGKNSVGANVGINGRIKGITGTWITLAEYDSSNTIKYVKSAQIDGKILKENTWYQLKNNEFKEVK